MQKYEKKTLEWHFIVDEVVWGLKGKCLWVLALLTMATTSLVHSYWGLAQACSTVWVMFVSTPMEFAGTHSIMKKLL